MMYYVIRGINPPQECSAMIGPHFATFATVLTEEQ